MSDTVADFDQVDSKVRSLGMPMPELIEYFRTKCRACGHHRIMHDAEGVCGGVMNKPCMSGCDMFEPE